MGDRRSIEVRFWTRVTLGDGCWLWHGAHQPDGRGAIGYKGELTTAPRISWLLHFGEIPNGLHVLHKCDVPACVRPEHLFLGTNLDNIKDAQAKGRLKGVGRGTRGEKSPSAKLRESDIIKIRAETGTLKSIGELYGVSLAAIHKIRKRKSWAHIP